MTYIEFYDCLSIVNICACLTNLPERVVLIGGDKKDVQENIERYRRLFRQRGHEVEFIHHPVKDKNKLDQILEALREEIRSNEDCAVNLTGGDSLQLVAMGMIYQQRRRQNIQLHLFNLHNNTIFDCDQDGVTIEKESPQLTVEENIHIYGGDVVYEEDMPNTTYRWNMTPEFERDIDQMWELCRKDPKKWNHQINALTRAYELFAEKDYPLELDISIQTLSWSMGDRYEDVKPLLRELYRKGLLYFYMETGDRVSLIFKDEQVFKCLIKAGTLLEMKVYRLLRHTQEKGGTPVYNDVMQGVFIDWGPRTDASKVDTANEVDVLAMKGMIPVFISCKNGIVKADELYKLQSVAEHFGRGYAKKILIATSLDDTHPATAHFRQRAEDMKIRIIDDLHLLSDSQIQETFRKLWR